MFNNAIILAAGLGTRMRPLTEQMPKPLIEVAGKALVDWAIELVADGGTKFLVINTCYKADMLESHVAKCHKPQIAISREPKPLETGGGIANALDLLGEAPFFSLNSDTICLPGAQNPLINLAKAWDDTSMDALLLLHPTKAAIGYHGAGDFYLYEEGYVERRGARESAPYVFTGVQLIHPRLFEHAPTAETDGVFSMNTLFDRDLSRIHAVIHDGDWLHVGDVSGLARAEAYFRA